MPRSRGFIYEFDIQNSDAGLIFVCGGQQTSPLVSFVPEDDLYTWLVEHPVIKDDTKDCHSPDTKRVTFNVEDSVATDVKADGWSPSVVSSRNFNYALGMPREREDSMESPPTTSVTFSVEAATITLSGENASVTLEVSNARVTLSLSSDTNEE